MAKYHLQLHHDARSLVRALAPSEERLQARLALHERLREIIQSDIGDDFDIKDISMLNYAEDLDIAPMELMLVDDSRFAGLRPGTNFSNLPDVYYPSRLASFLQDYGFDGVIPSADIQRRDNIKGGGKRSDPPPHAEDGAFRWPRYTRSPKPEIIYPTVLEATTPEQFRLSLPCPTIGYTHKLLNVYSRKNPHLRLMISLIYIWMRSWDIKEVNPQTLCLLLIRFFQEEEVLRLVDAGRSTSVSAEQVKAQASAYWSTTVWMQFDAREGPNQPVLLDVSFALYPPSHPTSDFPPVLLRFLRWIVSKKFHHICTGEGEKWPILRINHPNILEGRFSGELRTFDETKLPWSHHQLIVPDPFVPTHNHAFNVHRSTLHYLSVLAETCASLLRTARPLHTIFGPYYQPEILAKQRHRSPSPSPIQPGLTHSLTGIRTEHLRYFSDTRVREELMKMYRTTVPHQRVREMRQRTVAKVASAIQDHFGREYRVEVFGSTRYGVDGQTSDLDMVVIDPDRMTGFAPDVDLNSLPRIYKLGEVSSVLQRSGFKILKKIPTATVPIVKFKDVDTGVQCDLNINDQLGCLNTSLIRHYCDILPILRPLLLAIKRWARPLGYNNPAGAPGTPITFSSYTLTIMTIGFLQTRGFLPNLQEGTVLPEGGTFWLRTRAQERIRCDAIWKKAPDWIPPVVEVEQAFQDWFQYWGHEHDYRNTLINMRLGGVVPREVPCDRKESEALRDGPFSGFRQPSSEKGTAGKSPPMSTQDKKQAQLEAGVRVLKGQTGHANQASKAAGTRIDGQPIMGEEGDEDGRAEDKFNESGSETEHDPAEDEDVFGLAQEADDNAQPSQWESDILCVADPFIRTKNLAGPIRPHIIVRFREDCQRVVMRLRMGGNLDALLRLDLRNRPPSPPPSPHPGRRQQTRRGIHDGGRGRNLNQPTRGPPRGGAPTTNQETK